MRIVVLSQWYAPEPATLIQQLSESLAERGHEVTVLTGFPNYGHDGFYDGYRGTWPRREELNDVEVVRVPLYPNHGRSSLRRAANYLSFAFSSSAFGLPMVRKPDVVFVYHPPLTIGFPGLLLSRLWRAPFVLQVQDLWPESLAAVDMISNDRVLAGIGRAAEAIYRQAASICVISDGFRRSIVARGIPPEKVHSISNWVDTNTYYPTEPDPELAAKVGLGDKFNVMFAGNIGEAQDLDRLLDAAELLLDVEQIQFVVVGDGIALPRLKQAAIKRGLNNVRFLGRYPSTEMPSLYALASVLHVQLRDDPLFEITVPHKIFAYMASGKPIVAAVRGDGAEVILGAGAGVVCEPGSGESLAAAVRRLYEMPAGERNTLGEAGLAEVHAQYSREFLVDKIESVLVNAVAQ